MSRRVRDGAHRDRSPRGRAIVALGIAAMAVGLTGIAVTMSPPAYVPAAVGAAAVSQPISGTPPDAAVVSPTATSNGASARSTPSRVPGASLGARAATVHARFPGGLLIADRGNGRLLVVTDAGHVVWTFPGPHGLPAGQRFSADDAFIAPDGRTIVANDEEHQVVDRIDIATRRVTWQYGEYDRPGRSPGRLHTPDDAYPLANGDIVVADIRNCRILEIAPSKRIVRQWGRAGVCSDHPPRTFASPNGDTPLPDGGLLVTEISGSRVVRLRANGHVAFDVHLPVAYPSDAQLERDGSILVVDYSSPGAVLRLSPTGRVLWRYAPRKGTGALDHPSLAIQLADGTIALNDDFRHRVLVIDPRTNRIVWQYGRTDRPGRRPGSLNIPDGIDVLPAGTIPGLG